MARSVLSASAVVGVAALVLTGGTASFADTAPAAQTTFVNEGFTGTTAGSGYTLPKAASGSNVACLTGRTGGTTATDSIPGCGGTADADGNGALRLTSASNNQTGGIGAKQSVPITKGIDAVFDSYQYNGKADGSGDTADGIVFYLAATDPYNPAVPTQIGQLGGSLGYSGTKSGSGLAHAYLGLGLDRYGNFVHPDFEGTGCDTSVARPRYPNSVTVRGPGNDKTGYCVVKSTAGKVLTGSLSTVGATNRSQAKVPVEIVINPTASAISAQRATSVSVDPGSFAVIFTPINGSQQVLTGALPKLALKDNAAAVPASWIDPATGFPYKLTYGWVAGTGGASDIHEVNYLEAKTAAGPVPVLSVATGGDDTVPHAGGGSYTITPTVSAAGGTESQLVRTTTTFPEGVQPVLPSAPAAGWSCTIVGQVETCDYAVDASAPVQPGTVLPTLALPYTVSGSPRTATISSVVASTDAEAVSVSRAVTIRQQQVRTTPADVTAEHGATATLTATVASTSTAPSAPTGTVTFTDQSSGDVLCTAPVVAGVAACETVAGAISAHTVLVGYSGDADHAAVGGADRASLTLTVTPIAVPVALAIAPAEVPYGTAATLSAGGIPADATGTLIFSAGGKTLCETTLPTTSCATAATLAAGGYEVTVAYSGDSIHRAATSASATLTVRKVAPIIDNGNGGPGTPGGGTPGGDPDTVTVVHGETTKLKVGGLPTDATGTISFVTDDGTVLCTATLPETTCDLPDDLPGGTYTVHSRYSGDDNYEPVSGDPFTVVIAPQPTTLVADQTSTGRTVTLRVSGLPAAATGTVTFRDAAGHVLCTVTLPDTSCDTDALPAGKNVVTAEYSGDASFAASSSQLTVTVAAAPSTPVPSPEPQKTPRAALASTGSSVAIGAGALLAAGLLAAGLTLQLRRRRETATTGEDA
ncbi:Ig-like domain repeat protein [Leifsonia sp. NPDC080035]|uniref:Ig-like domain repeat protein n=1 Tax=Leifsonia sp. NPDC080035 TaxID=3143936 RepID=A0AAU7GFR7_9MICO